MSCGVNYYRRPIGNMSLIGCAMVAVHKNGRFRGQEVVFEASVHKKWRFCGQEVVFEASVHKNGRFCGQEVVFEASVHKKWRFRGRECDRQKRDTLERMSP